MASPLADYHMAGERRLRAAMAAGLTRVWDGLPSHDSDGLEQWLRIVPPLVLGAQRASVALTDQYVAAVMGRDPLGIDPEPLIGASARGGVSPDDVYTRPFVTLWGKLGDGILYADAAPAARERAVKTAQADVQLAMARTLDAIRDADPNVAGYRRAVQGTCAYCEEREGEYYGLAQYPFHPGCGCGAEVVTTTTRAPTVAPATRDASTVRDHGELGALIVAADDHFTTEREAAARAANDRRNAGEGGSRNG